MSVQLIIAIIMGGIAGGSLLFALKQRSLMGELEKAEKNASRLVTDAEKRAKSIVDGAERDAEDKRRKVRSQVEGELNNRKRDLDDSENRLKQRQRKIDDAQAAIVQREKEVVEQVERAKELRTKQEEVLNELFAHLEKVTSMTKEDAEKVLLANVERETRERAGRMIKEIQESARKVANRKAKEIVLDAIQRTAVEHVVSNTTSVVSLPDDEMKGRIIGKEGRNIRAFESATGVDVIIDDTPNGVILSAFNPIRREIARMAMDKLVSDGRIHPTRVEEAVQQSRDELDDIMMQHGERAADELGQQFHPEIIKLFGKLHYRTSYGQSILSHSLEAAHIAGMMADELGVNSHLAKRGTMLHDIGKALDFEHEGSHDDLGADVCRKYGESEELINCIMAHHEDEAPDTVEAVIVMLADALSSARPGARKESADLYVKRLETLEKIANGFEGVDKAYAIQAGREIRVLVRPDQITDDGIHKLAQDIAKQIEDNVDYPGEVQVSLVRETRATYTAK
ncbi:MAG: ribonuclease Y [bacterium]|nr:ribonuclease Y [bacterium]